jgi:uridine kinase
MKLTILAKKLRSLQLYKEASQVLKLASKEIFAHISGPPASGKTTLMEEIQALHPDVVTKDLDEFDEIATEELGLDSLWKMNSWTEEAEKNQFDLKQNLLDKFLEENLGKRIVLVGIHTEWGRSLQFKAKYRILLNTKPKEAFERRKKRDMEFEGAWKFWEDEETSASELKESISIFED